MVEFDFLTRLLQRRIARIGAEAEIFDLLISIFLRVDVILVPFTLSLLFCLICFWFEYVLETIKIAYQPTS